MMGFDVRRRTCEEQAVERGQHVFLVDGIAQGGNDQRNARGPGDQRSEVFVASNMVGFGTDLLEAGGHAD